MKNTTHGSWRVIAYLAILVVSAGCGKAAPPADDGGSGADGNTTQQPAGEKDNEDTPNPGVAKVGASRLDGGSIGAYTLSLGKVVEELDEAQTHRFMAALGTVGREVVESSTAGNGDTKTPTREGAATRLSRRVDGMTADEVIALAHSINPDFETAFEGNGEQGP